MSDLLTHWAVFDDARRLIAFVPDMERFLRETIEQEIDFARVGAITRGGHVFILPTLKRVRDARAAGEDYPNAAAKLAYVLGCITHQPCDIHMNAMMKRLGSLGKRDISAYYDIHVFRTVYLDGREAPFNEHMFASNETEPGAAAEAFIRSCFQRAVLSSHTVKPDLENFDAWLDRFVSAIQRLYVSVELYVSVYLKPDPEKVSRYRVETEFYDESDALIRTARRIQRGDGVTERDVAAALEAERRCEYATAVQESVANLVHASELWRGEIDSFVVREDH